MVVVKVFESTPIPGLDSLMSSSISVPKLIETYSFKEEDKAAVQDLFSIYDPDKYMIVVKYREPAEIGKKWLEFSTMIGGLSGTSSILEYIVGEA